MYQRSNSTELVVLTKLDRRGARLTTTQSSLLILKIDNKGISGLWPTHRAHTQHNTLKSDDGVKGGCGNRHATVTGGPDGEIPRPMTHLEIWYIDPGVRSLGSPLQMAKC